MTKLHVYPQKKKNFFKLKISLINIFNFEGFNTVGTSERVYEASEGNDDHVAVYVGGYVLWWQINTRNLKLP